MEITVTKLVPTESELRGEKWIWATVRFWDENGPIHNSGSIEVAIDHTDTSIDELKAEAIQKAVEFLRLAISAHDG